MRRILVKSQNPGATLVQIQALSLSVRVQARGSAGGGVLNLSFSLVRWGVTGVNLPAVASLAMSVYRGPPPPPQVGALKAFASTGPDGCREGSPAPDAQDRCRHAPQSLETSGSPLLPVESWLHAKLPCACHPAVTTRHQAFLGGVRKTRPRGALVWGLFGEGGSRGVWSHSEHPVWEG